MDSTIYCPNIIQHYLSTKTNIFKKNNSEINFHNYLSFNIVIFISFIILVGMYLSYKYKEKQNKDNNNNCYIEFIVSIFVILFLIIYFIF